jgi:hypothetical protein
MTTVQCLLPIAVESTTVKQFIEKYDVDESGDIARFTLLEHFCFTRPIERRILYVRVDQYKWRAYLHETDEEGEYDVRHHTSRTLHLCLRVIGEHAAVKLILE